MTRKQIIEELTTIIQSLIDDLLPLPDDCQDCDGCSDCEGCVNQITLGLKRNTILGGFDYGWQSGDNSYSGGAYGFDFWGVSGLYSDSIASDIANEIFDEALDQMFV